MSGDVFKGLTAVDEHIQEKETSKGGVGFNTQLFKIRPSVSCVVRAGVCLTRSLYVARATCDSDGMCLRLAQGLFEKQASAHPVHITIAT